MSLSLKKPSKERSDRTAKKAAARLGDGEKRIVADVPEHIHTQVRITAALVRGSYGFRALVAPQAGRARSEQRRIALY